MWHSDTGIIIFNLIETNATRKTFWCVVYRVGVLLFFIKQEGSLCSPLSPALTCNCGPFYRCHNFTKWFFALVGPLFFVCLYEHNLLQHHRRERQKKKQQKQTNKNSNHSVLFTQGLVIWTVRCLLPCHSHHLQARTRW